MLRSAALRKKYRVIQWGTGMVGTHALRAICERADLELAGVFAYSPTKVGKDAGDIFGAPATGVSCVSTMEEVLAIEADCVNYNALGSSPQTQAAALDDICALLEAGFNVTSTAVETLIYPAGNRPELLERIDRACRKGNASLFVSGVNPGYMFDVLPITLSRLCRRIDRLHCAEIASMTHMTSVSHTEALGFGLPPGLPAPFEAAIGGAPEDNAYSTVLHLLADALHVDLDKVEFRTDHAVSDKPIAMPAKTLEPGTVTVRKFAFVGWSKGRDVIQLDFIWRVDPDVRPDWPTGDKYVVRIEGDPSVQTEVQAQTSFDAKRPISLYVAMAGVNAIPTICESPPGLKNVLDLPMWGARMATSDF
jgi:4-hydroxy-tetrahydrodipicolinate reductase